jgi:hypothetical protein
MCRAGGRAAIAVLALVAARFTTAGPLVAQETPSQPTEAELLRAIESMRPVLEEARAAAAAARERRELEEAARPLSAAQLVRVGPLAILAPPEQAELAASLFEEVWRESFDGVSGSPSLAVHVFVFRWTWTSAEPLRVDAGASGHTALRRVELTRAWARTRGAAKVRVREALWAVLRNDLAEQSPLRGWVGSHPFPSGERVSRLVTLEPATENRECLAGDDDACLAALGLAGGGMSVPPEAPAMVLMEAVRMGGPGAWARLLERSHAEPAEALELAAGVEVRAVAAAWRDALLEQRPEIHAGLAGQAARALLWFLVLAGLATRSTRWRIA